MSSEARTEAEQRMRAARVARWSVSTIFFLNGAGYANWVVRIPAVQERLALSAGSLGLALLGVSLGALVTMPLVGGLVARVGSRPVTSFAAFAFCLAVPLPGFAPSLPLLALSLFVIGATSGALDVSMNAQAVTVERHLGYSVMSSFHGLFSLGGLAGSAMGGFLASRGVSPERHLMGVAVALFVVALVAARSLLHASADASSDAPAFARPSRALLALGVLAFCVLLGEGAMADWSAVYLRDSVGSSPGFAATGYAAFSLAMAAGRFTGDTLTARLGPVRLVRGGGVLAAAGLGGALVLGHPVAAVVGFGCVGAGLSAIFPSVLSAAGRTHAVAPGTAIAAVSTLGYTGFLAGPPLIGFVAELVTLRGALGVVVLTSFILALLAFAVGRSDAPETAPSSAS